MERTIQRRISDTVDFNKGWDDYVHGFGETDGNYWMGLEEMHQLTTAHEMSLDVNIETFEGEPFTVKLQTFYVGNAEGKYQMFFSGYSQTSDRLTRAMFPNTYNGTKFTTWDRDNDSSDERNCASQNYRGGWWYTGCGRNSLNGNYEGDITPTKTGIVVLYIDVDSRECANTKAVKSVEMIIRKRVE